MSGPVWNSNRRSGSFPKRKKKLSTDVLARYSSAAIRLDIDVTEKRLFLNQHGGGRFFLPLVKLDGRSVMVNTFPVFAGNAYEPLNFTEIIRADYKVDSPDAPDSSAGIPPGRADSDAAG